MENSQSAGSHHQCWVLFLSVFAGQRREGIFLALFFGYC